MAARKPPREQGSLFDTGEPGDPDPPVAKKRGGAVEAATVETSIVELGKRLPKEIRLGTSSWSFPGWQGLVYADKYSDTKLSKQGLAAYARHPLFRTVGLDRTHYAPMSREQFSEHAAQVPDDFRFLVKAHEVLTLHRFPTHPRYGVRKGQENDRFLSVEYAIEHCIDPMVEGLGDKAGPLLFQIAPQNLKEIGGAAAFRDRLHAFLSKLPKGPLYAVEIRNKELLTSEYVASLTDAGVVHCLNSLKRMPPLDDQARRTNAERGKALVVRWMVHKSQDYESALDRYEPFDKLVDEDPETRDSIAKLVLEGAAAHQPVYTIINNKAEGSSPLSVLRLAETIARKLAGSDTPY